MPEKVLHVWLDDERNPAHYGRSGWFWIGTYAHCISLLKTGRVKEISLDHDLVYPDHLMDPKTGRPVNDVETGYHVALWMEKHNIWPDKVYVHTASTFGAKRIKDVLERNSIDYEIIGHGVLL